MEPQATHRHLEVRKEKPSKGDDEKGLKEPGENQGNKQEERLAFHEHLLRIYQLPGSILGTIIS